MAIKKMRISVELEIEIDTDWYSDLKSDEEIARFEKQNIKDNPDFLFHMLEESDFKLRTEIIAP